MNRIDTDELFTQISRYLKGKGIHLEEGSYTRTIQKGCQVLADTINLSQQAMEKAATELRENLERARQVIHEKSAPGKAQGTTGEPGGKSTPGAKRARSRKTAHKPRKTRRGNGPEEQR